LSAVKQLVSEKKISRGSRAVGETPEGISRQCRFGAAPRICADSQAQIARELQQQKFVQEVKKLFDSAQFEEAYQVALAGLKTFS